jgi:hypothetical protein
VPVVTLAEYPLALVMEKTAPASGARVARSSLVTRIAPGKPGVPVALAVAVALVVDVAVGAMSVGVLLGVTVAVFVGTEVSVLVSTVGVQVGV